MEIDVNVLQSYLDPKMLIVIVALWAVGSIIKKLPSIPDKWIILILTAISLTLAVLILGVNEQAIIQGIIAVCISVYSHQILKQSTK